MAYLSGGDDLKRAESGLQVGSASLKIVESGGDLSLELRRLCARWAVRRDLVDGTHGCGCRGRNGASRFLESNFQAILCGRMVR